MPPFRTYKGAIHIHSRFSDGSGRVKDIVKAAQDAGLDYIIISDHDELPPEQLKFQGWHKNLLVVCGVELAACRLGGRHFLALGVDSHLPYRKKPLGEKLERIQEDGGISIIAHPSGPFKPWRGQTHFAWRKFPESSFHGLEIWTYLHDWMSSLVLTRLRESINRSDHYLRGPDARLLAQWDELNQRRRVAGIGSQDNHARWVPFLKLRVFAYEYLFRRLLTHVVMEEFTGDAKQDISALLAALRDGRAYFANNGIAPADGFQFIAEDDKNQHLMGAWLEGPAKVLRISAPEKAEVRLICNGAAVASDAADHLDLHNPAPGAYRVEMRINGNPWLFSNHINVAMPRTNRAEP